MRFITRSASDMGILDQYRVTEAYLIGVHPDSAKPGEAGSIIAIQTARLLDKSNFPVGPVEERLEGVCVFVRYANKDEVMIPFADLLAGKYRVATDAEVDTRWVPKGAGDR